MRNFFTKLLPGIAMVCALLSGASYELGDIATLFPPEWKPIILKLSVAAYAIGRLVEWIAKEYFPEIKVEPAKKPSILPVLILAGFLTLGLFGCQARNWSLGGGFTLQDGAGNSVSAGIENKRATIAFRNSAMQLRVEGFEK